MYCIQREASCPDRDPAVYQQAPPVGVGWLDNDHQRQLHMPITSRESLHSILPTTTSQLLPPLLTYLSAPSSYLKDLRGGNDFLGKTFVGLNDLPLKGEESWFDLQSHRGRPRGRVQIKLHIDIKMVSGCRFVLFVVFS